SEEKEIQTIIKHWIRTLNIKFGWINDFDKFVAKYATNFFIFEEFYLSSKLLNTLTKHIDVVWSIDYSTFNDNQFICSGSKDNTIRVWDINANKQIKLYTGHPDYVYCVKFSPYHHYTNRRSVICSSSNDETINFWDFKHNKQLQIFNGHTRGVCCIEFSSFNGGKYLCSGSYDKTIRLWDIETSKSLHIFNGHTDIVRCLDISPLQNNNNNNNNNNIGIIGGNGYTICSGSFDKTIQISDIETTKQLILFKGHTDWIRSVKYGSNKLTNIILSGSEDKSVRLWDIRSCQQIQSFNRHTYTVNAIEYSPFIVNNIEIGGSSNVICSGSWDNTIRFWDIRSNRNELYIMKGENNDDGIVCFKFLQLKKKEKKIKGNNNLGCDIKLCYGSLSGLICIWG
ncbi:G-protein beta WD-40 repeats containing protein, partial [Reticulomyxa filosa]